MAQHYSNPKRGAPAAIQNCACRDCFDTALDDGLCFACEDAGCVSWPGGKAEDKLVGYTSFECQRKDAYGMDTYCQAHGNAVCKVCPKDAGERS